LVFTLKLNIHNTTFADSMASSIDVHQCDYLRPHSLPLGFTSELVNINEQISSLDSHISQLITLRDALRRRSRQLHNLLSPIQTLPIEVLSYIFQQLVDPDQCYRRCLPWYRRYLTQALVLSSVSSHFRRVAFGTSKLWKCIPLYITNGEAIGKASSLLQHCIALAPTINISVFDRLDEEGARSAIDILLTSDVTRKVKIFELYGAIYASPWVEKLEGSSFPMLGALSIRSHVIDLTYDFGTLKTLTRLCISDHSINRPIIMPLSLQHLNIAHVTPLVFLSVASQCLNLVECAVDFESEFFDNLDGNNQFSEPVTLNHLKRLNFRVLNVREMSLWAERFRLPSLETLELEHGQENTIAGARPLCHSVSATLTTLVINTLSDTLNYDDLYQLYRLPFPKLRRLEFWSGRVEPFLSAIHALALLDNECSTSEARRLPTLRFILLRCSSAFKPRSLLDLLKKWRIGEAFYFHIQLHRYELSYSDWSPELRQELKSIIGERRIEVTWGVHQL
jgi:hypothetical protein